MFAVAMQVKGFLSAIFLLLLGAAFLLSGGGCANVVPPSGGPRDSLPPAIVEVDPPNESTNFNSRDINIAFSEYVELDNPFQNLVISPLPKVFPEVKRKLKTISIRLKDSLEDNTTYVFNFKNSIKDITEGNKAKDLLYVFSTGSYFDSLQLSGNVKMARTVKPDSTLTIMLHQNLDDSAVAKERPRYIAKVDSAGTFFFRYLAPGTYRIYALKDEGSTYLYTSKSQVFAFADEPVVLTGGAQHEPIRLYAYAEEETKPESSSQEEDEDEERRLKFTTNLEGSKQDLLQAFVMKFDSPLRNFDSTKMKLSIDSAFTPASGQYFTLDSTHRQITMNMPWQENTKYNLVLEKDFATDSLGRHLLKADTVEFQTKARAEYGQVKLTFLNLDMSINPVLLLMQNGAEKYALPLTSNVINIQLINPGDYEMQILHDRNKNGKWDPGAFFTEHRQPEMITLMERKLNVKPNWVSEFEVQMQK